MSDDKTVEKPKPKVIDVPGKDGSSVDGKPGKRKADAKSEPDQANDAEPAHAEVAPAPTAGQRATLRLTHIEPWTATRVAFAVSCAMAIVFVVAAVVFWVVMQVTGVFGQFDDAVSSVLSDGTDEFSISNYFGFWRVILYALMLSVINIVATTALAAIGARIYNTVAELMGGIQVTFSDD